MPIHHIISYAFQHRLDHIFIALDGVCFGAKVPTPAGWSLSQETTLFLVADCLKQLPRILDT